MTATPSAPFALRGRRVFVAGHRGMVGAAVLRRLAREGTEVLTAGRTELDLRRQADVEAWLASAKPDAVVVAAATVGGILANDSRPAEFLYDNLAIETAVIHGAWKAGVKKLLFLGSTCIYPRLAPQPMKEEHLLSGPLEPTNQWYAVAKIAGLKLCEAYRRQYGADFISAMPTNLYGPGDTYDLRGGHVIPALILKAHRAKLARAESFEVWGTGSPTREFLHVDDLADALVFLLANYSGDETVNVGTGEEVTIAGLAHLVAKTVGFEGRVVFDKTKPDGTPRKLADSAKLAGLGWRARISLADGLKDAYAWFLANAADKAA
jgi:GDP-L-fucose synthase